MPKEKVFTIEKLAEIIYGSIWLTNGGENEYLRGIYEGRRRLALDIYNEVLSCSEDLANELEAELWRRRKDSTRAKINENKKRG
jgi:hypothetical protein